MLALLHGHRRAAPADNMVLHIGNYMVLHIGVMSAIGLWLEPKCRFAAIALLT